VAAGTSVGRPGSLVEAVGRGGHLQAADVEVTEVAQRGRRIVGEHGEHGAESVAGAVGDGADLAIAGQGIGERLEAGPVPHP
jgi:hypothetical protein